MSKTNIQQFVKAVYNQILTKHSAREKNGDTDFLKVIYKQTKSDKIPLKTAKLMSFARFQYYRGSSFYHGNRKA